MIGDKCGIMAVCSCLSDANVEQALIHPLAMLCSDGKILCNTGDLSAGKPHPRNYGAFPRFICRYVREKGSLSLEDAVRRMTSYPAQKIGLHHRGILKCRMKADILIFDAEKIKDNATFDNPHQYASGIGTMIINGVVTVYRGRHTGARAGSVLNCRDGCLE
ncbi:MAG: amidohydrolase family protein [Peptococcaceae bacterium]|nr:amidohydrolase family protein [Peptococcaceae bacterium]